MPTLNLKIKLTGPKGKFCDGKSPDYADYLGSVCPCASGSDGNCVIFGEILEDEKNGRWLRHELCLKAQSQLVTIDPLEGEI